MALLNGEGGGNAIVEVANYSALPAANTVTGELYAVLASQGTAWLPGSLGGTYYPKGLYYSDGVDWIYTETPYNATQATVNAGTNDDQFVTSKTLKNSTQFQYLDATSSIQTQLDNRTTLLVKNNVQVAHTGTLTETLILSYDLTNLFAANDIIKTNFRVCPNNTANTKTIRIKVNTSATLTGAKTLGTYAFTSSAANFQKALWFENTLASIKAMYATSTVSNDETSNINILGLNTITHDFTGPTFFLISAQLTVISDTLYFLNGEILRKR